MHPIYELAHMKNMHPVCWAPFETQITRLVDAEYPVEPKWIISVNDDLFTLTFTCLNNKLGMQIL
jgi:hypothetical protein